MLHNFGKRHSLCHWQVDHPSHDPFFLTFQLQVVSYLYQIHLQQKLDYLTLFGEGTINESLVRKNTEFEGYADKRFLVLLIFSRVVIVRAGVVLSSLMQLFVNLFFVFEIILFMLLFGGRMKLTFFCS